MPTTRRVLTKQCWTLNAPRRCLSLAIKLLFERGQLSLSGHCEYISPIQYPEHYTHVQKLSLRKVHTVADKKYDIYYMPCAPEVCPGASGETSVVSLCQDKTIVVLS